MNKKAMLVVASFILAMFVGIGSAVADEVMPGAAIWQDPSVMGVGKTMMEMGATDRARTEALNRNSGSMMARHVTGGLNQDYQFGSSQSNQSWKQEKTVEEASVVGLVPGDCRGDNSDDRYRRAMNQSRDGYMKETLVPNSMCADIHPTLK